MNKTELKTISQRLAIMFAGFPQSPVKDVDLQMEAYMTTLEREADRGEGFEFQDIIAAIERIMGGGEGLPLRAGCPNVVELCHECRERRKMRKLMEARAIAGNLSQGRLRNRTTSGNG